MIWFQASVGAVTIALTGTGGYQRLSADEQDYATAGAGIGVMLPLGFTHGLGAEYSYLHGFGLKSGDEPHSSSEISLAYRNYLGNRPMRRNSAKRVLPFLAVSPTLFIFNHRNVLPGFELQLGIDILFRNGFVFADPVTYPVSHALKIPQILTVAFKAGMYADSDRRLYDVGLKIGTGVVF